MNQLLTQDRQELPPSSGGQSGTAPREHLAALDSAVLHLAVHTDLAKIEQEWRAFEKTAACTVFQSFAWLSAWQRHIGGPRGIVPCIVTGREPGGGLVFLLPFAVETRGLVRRLFWLGSAMCDYNAPIVADAFLRNAGHAQFAALWPDIVACLRQTLGARFDLVDLCRMPDAIEGYANPAIGLKVVRHPSGAHAATLGTSWDGFYAARRSAATRRKERKKLRRLSEFGKVSVVQARTPAERASVIDTLISQKRRWFAQRGVRDLFAPVGTREFFMTVATDFSLRDSVHLCELRVGETAAATGFGLRHKDRYYLFLCSYGETEFTKYGPGCVLLHALMEGEIARGTRHFDFTVGDEAYKRPWSDIDIALYDYLQPMTWRGRAAAWAISWFRRFKGMIKRSQPLWRAYYALCRWKARVLRGAKALLRPPRPVE